jgi:hypothetical protein
MKLHYLFLLVVCISCDRNVKSKSDSINQQTSFRSFKLVGEYYYNSRLNDAERIKNTYASATFNGKVFDLEYSVIGNVDLNNFLKSVDLSFGRFNENGQFIREPVKWKDFLKEFSLKYDTQLPGSVISEIAQEHINSLLEYIQMKRRFNADYEGSSEFEQDENYIKLLSSTVYFLSKDGNIVVECNIQGIGSEPDRNWKVTFCNYSFIDDWKIEKTKAIKDYEFLSSNLLEEKQAF